MELSNDNDSPERTEVSQNHISLSHRRKWIWFGLISLVYFGKCTNLPKMEVPFSLLLFVFQTVIYRNIIYRSNSILEIYVQVQVKIDIFLWDQLLFMLLWKQMLGLILPHWESLWLIQSDDLHVEDNSRSEVWYCELVCHDDTGIGHTHAVTQKSNKSVNHSSVYSMPPEKSGQQPISLPLWKC